MKNICKFVSSNTQHDLEVTRFIYEANPEAMSEPQVLQDHIMILVVQGKGVMTFQKTKVPFSSGKLIFGFAGETFLTDIQETTEYMYIDFKGLRTEELFLRFGINPAHRCFSGFEGVIPLWKSSLLQVSGPNIDLAAESMLLYTLSKFDAAPAKENRIISQIIALTEEYFINFDLSLENLSKELGYNPKYLSHLFKEKMGIGYSAYLQNRRIEYAITLFEHGIDSVKNVASLSGFKDPYYFSAVFKRHVGVSPKYYKRKDTKR